MANKSTLTETLSGINQVRQEAVDVETTPKLTAMVPPSRQGKKMISGHFDKDVHRQLKMLALEKETSIQDLLSQALNALFERNDMPPIA
jgi:predicted HicB family RNase H-like nuclease